MGNISNTFDHQAFDPQAFIGRLTLAMVLKYSIPDSDSPAPTVKPLVLVSCSLLENVWQACGILWSGESTSIADSDAQPQKPISYVSGFTYSSSFWPDITPDRNHLKL
jgi:hypothetical protein